MTTRFCGPGQYPTTTARRATGLYQHQLRRYDAWYRHITLAMLARAYLSVIAAAPQ